MRHKHVFLRRRKEPEQHEPSALEVDTEQSPDEAIVEPASEKWRRRRILSIYLLTSTLLWADLSLMAPNLTAIAEEFGFNDDERDVKLGGMIALAFFLVGVPVALLIGWLTDFVNRSPLYAATVFIGEAACIATYFTTTFAQLFAMRTFTGISIGGSLPVIFSVLGDLYPVEQRNSVAAIITCGTGLGIGLGQGLAGFLGPTYGWRFPFLIVSVPGMACSWLLLLVKDPDRGRKEAARIQFDDEMKGRDHPSCEEDKQEEVDTFRHRDLAIDESSLTVEPGCFDGEEKMDEECGDAQCTTTEDGQENVDELSDEQSRVATAGDDDKRHVQEPEKKVSWKTTWEMLKTPSVALVLLQAGPSALPFGFGSVFLNDYLAENRGMTVEEATGVLITFGVGNAIGVLFGGLFGHYGYKRNPRWPPIIMGTSLILSCAPMYFLVNWVDGDANVGVVAVTALLAGVLAVIPVPLERAILTNVTVPESRGRANSFLSIIDDLGKGLGPALVSVIIQALDRPQAFNISLLGWILGGMISYSIACFVTADEERTQERVREALEQEQAFRHNRLVL